MKKEKKRVIVFNILLLLFILALIGLFNNAKAQEIGKDKFYHFYYGSFASGIGSIIYCNSTIKPTFKGKLAVSFGSALAVGLAKEIYDSRAGGTGFNVADLGATVLGAIPISIVFSLEQLDKKKKNKIKRKYRY